MKTKKKNLLLWKRARVFLIYLEDRQVLLFKDFTLEHPMVANKMNSSFLGREIPVMLGVLLSQIDPTLFFSIFQHS